MSASLSSGFVRSKRRPRRFAALQIPCFALLFLGNGACAMSGADHNADNATSREQPTITVVGRLTNEGVECQALRADDGTLYTLLGEVGVLPVDTRVSVSGERLEFSSCQQGITIRVRSITPAANGI
jgi:hypothetical protein